MREATQGEEIPRGDLGIIPTSFATEGPKTIPRWDYERIFVVDDPSSLLGEYVLNDACPLEFADLVRSLPLSGMRHGVSFFQGEYAFTPYRVDNLWFVLLTRGVPRLEDRGSIGTLLAAARVHIVPNLAPALAQREAQARERERELLERDTLLARREQRALQIEHELQVVGMRLKEMEADLRMREMRLKTLRDYALQIQRSYVRATRKEEAADLGGAPTPAPEIPPGATQP